MQTIKELRMESGYEEVDAERAIRQAWEERPGPCRTFMRDDFSTEDLEWVLSLGIPLTQPYRKRG